MRSHNSFTQGPGLLQVTAQPQQYERTLPVGRLWAATVPVTVKGCRAMPKVYTDLHAAVEDCSGAFAMGMEASIWQVRRSIMNAVMCLQAASLRGQVHSHLHASALALVSITLDQQAISGGSNLLIWLAHKPREPRHACKQSKTDLFQVRACMLVRSSQGNHMFCRRLTCAPAAGRAGRQAHEPWRPRQAQTASTHTSSVGHAALCLARLPVCFPEVCLASTLAKHGHCVAYGVREVCQARRPEQAAGDLQARVHPATRLAPAAPHTAAVQVDGVCHALHCGMEHGYVLLVPAFCRPEAASTRTCQQWAERCSTRFQAGSEVALAAAGRWTLTWAQCRSCA